MLDDTLVVTAPAADQQAVAALLADLRRASGRRTTVRVDAAWLLLTPAEVAGGGPPPAVSPANVYCQARTVGFDGQTQAVTVGRTQTVVTDLTPVVAPGVALFNPTVGTAESGVSLTVTARVGPDRTDVTVDVDSIVTTAVPRDRPAAVAPATQPVAAVDDLNAQTLRAFEARPDHGRQQFRTTVRLTPRVPAIVGGSTDRPGADGDHRVLCLVLTARLDDAATNRP